MVVISQKNHHTVVGSRFGVSCCITCFRYVFRLHVVFGLTSLTIFGFGSCSGLGGVGPAKHDLLAPLFGRLLDLNTAVQSLLLLNDHLPCRSLQNLHSSPSLICISRYW